MQMLRFFNKRNNQLLRGRINFDVFTTRSFKIFLPYTTSIFLPLASLAEFTLGTFRSVFVQNQNFLLVRSQNCTTSNTPTYDINTQSLRHIHRQIITTQSSTATPIEYIKPPAIQDIISMDIQRPFQGFPWCVDDCDDRGYVDVMMCSCDV
jgi:hypothetical protein